VATPARAARADASHDAEAGDDIVLPLARKKGEARRGRKATADFKREDVRAEPRTRKTTADFQREGRGASDDKPRRTTAEMEAKTGRRRDTAAMERPASGPPAAATPVHGARRTERKRERTKSLPPSPGNRWSDLASPTPTDAIARRAARARSVLPTRLGEDRRVPVEPQKHQGGDLGSVLASLRGSRTRDDALRLACEGVLPVCRAAVFLVLQKGILRGRHAFGPGLTKQAIENLWIPTTSRSMFNRAVETGQPYVGPHGSSSADAVFRAAIGSRGAEIVLMPVVLSGRTIAVLALDEPEDVDAAFERAEVVAQATGDALRRIIVSGKSG
jgi:hypothetical protein